MKWADIIQYVSDLVMFLIVFIWVTALVYSGIVVWSNPDELCCFTELASVVTEVAVVGYFGRIAITHWQTIKKTGMTLAKDFTKDEIVSEDDDDLECEDTIDIDDEEACG